MSADAHTPGPWGVECTGDTNWVGPLGPDGKVESVVCALERADLKPETRRRRDADACLIAAAPDLLAAAKECLAASAAAMRVVATLDVRTLFSDDMTHEQAFIDEVTAAGVVPGFGVRAQRAIARAEGGA